MLFLRNLLRGKHAVDEQLPLKLNTRIRDENNVSWPTMAVKRFLNAQKLVCTPTFVMSLHKQVVVRKSGQPIVEAVRVAGEKDGKREVYKIKFHDEHLRPSECAEPSER